MIYYDLNQAIKLFSDAKIYPFFDLTQIADLCRQDILTPVFPYSLYISQPVGYEDSGRPIYEPVAIHRFRGHLTHDDLIILIDNYRSNLNLFNAAEYAGGKHEIRLFIKYQRDSYHSDDAKPFTVKLENIRIAADEVHRHIDDMKAKLGHASNDVELSDNTAKSYQTTIGLLLELLLEPKGFVNGNKDRPPLYDNQSAIVTALAEKKVWGQGQTTIDERFTISKRKLLDTRK